MSDFFPTATSHAQELITLENVSMAYNSGPTATYALRNVSLSVREGKFLAVMGKSEQGKSTLLRCIAGDLQPTSGSVWQRGGVGEEAVAVRLESPTDAAEVESALTAGAQVLLADTASERDGVALRQVVDRHGSAVVMATMSPAAAAWADAVVFLRGGAVVDMVAGAAPKDISECLEEASRFGPQ